QVERVVRERQISDIADLHRTAGAGPAQVARSVGDHVLGQVDPGQVQVWAGAAELNQQYARPGAEVEHGRAGGRDRGDIGGEAPVHPPQQPPGLEVAEPAGPSLERVRVVAVPDVP